MRDNEEKHNKFGLKKKELPKSNGSRAITMGLLHSTGCGCRFSRSLQINHELNNN